MTARAHGFSMSAIMAALLAEAVMLCSCGPSASRSSDTQASAHTPATKAVFKDLVGRDVRITRDVRRIVLPRSKDIYLLAVLLGDELSDRLAAWVPTWQSTTRNSTNGSSPDSPGSRTSPSPAASMMTRSTRNSSCN